MSSFNKNVNDIFEKMYFFQVWTLQATSQQFLNYWFCTANEKEATTQKFFEERLFINTWPLTESLFSHKVSGCRSETFLRKCSITRFSWLNLWNFAEQSSLSTLVISPMQKNNRVANKRNFTWEPNAWISKIKKIKNIIIVSSILVYFIHISLVLFLWKQLRQGHCILHGST